MSSVNQQLATNPFKKHELFGGFKKPEKISRKTILLSAGVVLLAAILFGGAEVYSNVGAHDNKNTGRTSLSNKQTESKNESSSSKLWDSKSLSGILALDGSQNIQTGSGTVSVPETLELIDPSNGSTIAEKALPSVLQVPASNNQTGYTLQTCGTERPYARYGGINSNVDTLCFNSNYLYASVQFNPKSDGSQDVGYENIETGKVTDISPKTSSSFGSSPTVYSNPSFAPNNQNLLVFNVGGACNGQANGAYNIATKQFVSSTDCGTIPGADCSTTATSTCRFIDEADPSYSLGNADGAYPLGLEDSNGNYPGIQTANGSGIDGTPLLWLNNGDLLVDVDNNPNGGNPFGNFLSVDIGDGTMQTDSSGDSYLEVSEPTSLLPNNKNLNTDPVLSPNGETIEFLSTEGNDTTIWQVPSAGGTPTSVHQADNNFLMVEWR